MNKATLEAQQQQTQLVELQTELLKKGEERKDFEAKVAATETNAKIDKIFDEMEKLKAETILLREQAETEQIKNNISVYTAHSDITAENERLRMEGSQQEHTQMMDKKAAENTTE